MSEENDLTLEMLLAMMDGQESGIAAARQLLKEKKGVVESKGSKWNPEGMKWVDVQGGNGPYQKSEDVDSSDFKEMLKDLAAHKGKLYRNGLFYWTFPTGATVGRKQVRKN
jgi:hypothetical protein